MQFDIEKSLYCPSWGIVLTKCLLQHCSNEIHHVIVFIQACFILGWSCNILFKACGVSLINTTSLHLSFSSAPFPSTLRPPHFRNCSTMRSGQSKAREGNAIQTFILEATELYIQNDFKNYQIPELVLIPKILKDCRKFNSRKTVQESLSESLFDALSMLEVVVLQTSSSKNVKSGKFLTPDLEICKRSILRDKFDQNMHLRSAEV